MTTDHHPLETILLKPLHDAPTRIQRLMVQIQPYDLLVCYSPNPDIPVAHAFSCLHLPKIDKELHADIEVFLHAITNFLPVSDAKIQEIKKRQNQACK